MGSIVNIIVNPIWSFNEHMNLYIDDWMRYSYELQNTWGKWPQSPFVFANHLILNHKTLSLFTWTKKDTTCMNDEKVPYCVKDLLWACNLVYSWSQVNILWFCAWRSNVDKISCKSSKIPAGDSWHSSKIIRADEKNRNHLNDYFWTIW
jgi:hypothetical protein